MENMRNYRKYRQYSKYRGNKLVTTERRMNYLVSELNYHTAILLQKIY